MIDFKEALSLRGLLKASPTVGGVVVLMSVITIWTNYRGYWLWSGQASLITSQANESIKRCETENAQLKADKTTLSDLVISGIRFGQERAQQSVDKINQAAPTSKPNVTLSVKPKPVSDNEKSAALSPVTNTDPKALASKQSAVQNLVQKTAPTQDAKVTKN